uniref:Transmembrane protein n=1 Tax=Medicago truncatula TaxID=3880 RepID=I3SJN4_MEDTR|nr:unknown [Medicago truncatula]
MHNTFLSWNLTIALVSLTLASRDSWWETSVGNLPALLRPGPKRRGICLITASEAKKAWYFFANFFTSFLFLFSFFKASTSIDSNPIFSASSTCWASPSMQIFIFGLGM